MPSATVVEAKDYKDTSDITKMAFLDDGNSPPRAAGSVVGLTSWGSVNGSCIQLFYMCRTASTTTRLLVRRVGWKAVRSA